MMQRYALFFFLFAYTSVTVAHPIHRSIEFVANQGQWDGPFLYKAVTPNSDIYLEPNGFTYIVGAAENPALIHDVKEGRIPSATLRYHAYKVIFEGANIAKEVTGSKPQKHYYNYFLGNNPDKWKTGIHPHLAVDYKEIYPNIDLHVASEESDMKYDLIVKPGGDPAVISMRYDGVSKLKVRNKKLYITTSLGTAEELAPFSFQYINGERKEVKCEYIVEGDKVSFHFPDGYDKTRILTIDPTVKFATFSGSSADNWGFTATYDEKGYLYAGGIVQGLGYRTTPGAYQLTFAGGGPGTGGPGGGNIGMPSDMGITKFDSNGTSIIYGTYLGGNRNDQPHSMVVDGSGNLYIAGRTYSSNFPTVNAYDATYNSAADTTADIVVVKLNATGNALLGSTYIGGSGEDGVNMTSTWNVTTSLKHSYADDARSEIIIDNAGNAYIAASTRSSNFPTANAVQTNLSGSTQDGVVFKLSSNLSTLLWSTYLGGSLDDAAYVLALNRSQSHIFVGGGTSSGTDFPLGGPGLWTIFRSNPIDGFIVKFQNSGLYLKEAGTFIGGTGGYDQVFGLQVDADNNVYAMGNTLGGGFPVTSGVFSVANSTQFIIKLDSNLSTDIYSTVFGSPNNTANVNISPVAFLVDTCQNVYISGWGGPTSNNGGNTNNMPVKLGTVTPANILSASTDGGDFYFIVLSKNAQTLLFGGYYGSTTINEHVDGGTSRFDKNGVIYQAICGGCGGSSSLPTTSNAYSRTNGSQNCNLAALKIAFEAAGVDANAAASPNTTICVGGTVQFQNGSANGSSYQWDFGDGTPVSTQFAPSHVYNQVGVFQVRLVVINPNLCITHDTAYLTITVDTNSIDAIFTGAITDSCNPYIISVTNSSKFGTNPGAAGFTWHWGDGNTSTGANPGTHSYSGPGTYTVKLVMTDPTACNAPDSVTQTFRFNDVNVDATFQTSDICFGDTVIINNMTTGGQTYLWKINGEDKSTDFSYYFLPDSAGAYNIKLFAYNDVACNKIDSAERDIIVNPSPTADFSFTPTELTIQPNDTIHFTNLSTDATLYNWNFGDGSGSQELNPSHFYKKTGYYNVCLYSSNKGGCSDTVCKKVYADVLPLADVPNAFSPNGDGNNDVLYVRGSAIQTVNLKIFNRWGELVFETNDKNIGWDGTFNGKPQEMDAYSFVLNATFLDESTYYKKGNVTLLR